MRVKMRARVQIGVTVRLRLGLGFVLCGWTAECATDEASGPPASSSMATGKRATPGSYCRSSAA